MEFLYVLENIRNPVLDTCMLLITQLGELTVFLAIAMILFWCVDKKFGYYIMSIGFVGVICNQFLKLAFRIPRPWVLDPNFTTVQGSLEMATGYSFPSGHTQSAVGTFGGIAYIVRNKWIRIPMLAAAVLVPFSRMYIGVHTPVDVLTSVAIAVVLILACRPLFFQNYRKTMPFVLATMLLMSIAFLLYSNLDHFPADIDPDNLASGVENSHTLLGAVLGFCVVYFVDSRYLKFPVEAVWWAQVLKVVLGLPIVLVVMSVLKDPLVLLLGSAIGRIVRYFLVVIVAGIIWPMTFRFFAKLGKESR